MPKKKMDFEASVLRMKEITELLEKGNVSLEQAIQLFSEGAALSASCYTALQEAEMKITQISTLRKEQEADHA